MRFGRKVYLGLFILLASAVLVFWQEYDPAKALTMSLPGTDNRQEVPDSIAELVNIGELFLRNFDDTPDLTGTWPRFRGENFDNISTSTTPLIDRFRDTIPPILWSVELGEGHAGAAIYKGLVYVLDYDEQIRADLLRCYDLLSGKEVWQRGYRLSVKRNHGMSRTIPAITEKYILSIGPRGHTMCLDRLSGDLIWGLDVEKEYLTEIPFWYTGQCPLIDNDQAIIATGGRAILIALDCATGELLWETPNPDGWKMSHSSVMPWTYKGRRMYVYSAVGGVCGIAADGENVGKVLWQTNRWNNSVVAPSPICMPDGRVYLAAGYGAGGMMLKVSGSGNSFSVEVLDQFKPSEGFSSEQQSAIYMNGHLFGIQPKDAGQYRNELICVNPVNPRNVIWSSGKTVRFGLGPFIVADNKMFILSDEGVLTIAQPSLTEYRQLDQLKVLDGYDAWGPIALADGYMVLRDSKTMICLDMRK